MVREVIDTKAKELNFSIKVSMICLNTSAPHRSHPTPV